MLKGERAQRRKEKETINTIDHREENREMLFVRRHLMKEHGGDGLKHGEEKKEGGKCTFRVSQRGCW